MGEVYRARDIGATDTKLNRQVALKILRPKVCLLASAARVRVRVVGVAGEGLHWQGR